MAEPVTLGRADEVPEGEMRSFQVGEDVAVANVGGSYYAFGDVCTHAHCSLADGDLEGTTVICACHGSEFDVRTGEVLGGPAPEPVPSWPVSVEDGELKVEL